MTLVKLNPTQFSLLAARITHLEEKVSQLYDVDVHSEIAEGRDESSEFTRSSVSGAEPFKLCTRSYAGKMCVYDSKRHKWAAQAYRQGGLYIIGDFDNFHNINPHLNADNLIDYYGVRAQYATIQSAGVCLQNSIDHSLQGCLVFNSGDVLPLLNPSLPF